MTVNKRIIDALSPLGIHVTADFFGDGEEKYITFNYVTDKGASYADDEPTADVAEMQIRVFTSVFFS